MTATLTPAEATTPIVWSSSDENIATVANGVVTAKAIGTAKIYATAGTVKDSCTVTVTAATPITVAQALEIAKTVSADNEIAAGGMYVIRGYVTALYGTPSSDMSTYGNYTVWLADAADGGEVFEAFRVIPTDGKTIAAVGDSVEVIADITKYKTTYETAAGGSISILKLAQYTITATANDDAMGTVAGAGKYDRDSEVTLTATANDGYEFVNWTNAANETIGTEATLTFTATQDSTIKANFKAQEPLAPATWYGQEPLTGTVSGVNYSLVYEITRNSTRTLTFNLALNDEAAAVAGLKITIVINNNQVGYITENFTSGVFTTSGYYTDGDELNIQFYLGSNNDGVYATAFKYIVGSSNNKPTAIDSVSAEAKATKRIVNGVLVIEKNGVRYNAQGVVME